MGRNIIILLLVAFHTATKFVQAEHYILDTEGDFGSDWIANCGGSDSGYFQYEDRVCRTPLEDSLIPPNQYNGHQGFWTPCYGGVGIHECTLILNNTRILNFTKFGVLAYMNGPVEISVTIIPVNGSERDYSITKRDGPGWTDLHDFKDVSQYLPIKGVRISMEFHSIATFSTFSILDQFLMLDDDFLIPTTTAEPTTAQITTSPTTITTAPPTTTTPTTTTITTTPATITTTERTTTFNPCINERVTGDHKNDGLNNFLVWAFSKFGNWLVEHGLDPTLPVMTPTTVNQNTSFLRFNGVFRHTMAWGLSFDTRLQNPDSDFITPQFSFQLHMSNLTVYGVYEAEGSIISMYPISGNGVWTLGRFDLDLSFHISGFAIENGFINVNKFDARNITLTSRIEGSSPILSMPEFIKAEDAGGLGREVLTILQEAIPTQLHSQDKHPVVQSVVNYLDVIFSETPLSDIIGWTPCAAL